eukprot:CAMPEP_0113942866 /NCGR_PEP_ID=MMETSP1339-20121228/13430_1 /TAXON_ID=94617 /ORGANISM="Fibrocapsa japonica" /LENGTH=208 /DNA_ID=CAMNT_0000947531 /DNA_START=63 /DNA_END=686 /DNA_ORIENTATION=- /assembly_acc=CAM_ASM_000762
MAEGSRGTKRGLDAGGDGEDNFSIKLLIPGFLAGCVIGKGGSVITDLQARTSTTIRMSSNRDYFPGTNDRVLMCTGVTDNVKTAITEIISRVEENFKSKGTKDGEPSSDEFNIGVSLPSAAAGCIIGRGGEVMKAIQASSGCKVRLASKDELTYPSERPATITGDAVGIAGVVCAFMDRLLSDRGLCEYQNPGTNYDVEDDGYGRGGG